MFEPLNNTHAIKIPTMCNCFFYKTKNGMLGTRTRGGRMVGTDESTELWRHPCAFNFTSTYEFV